MTTLEVTRVGRGRHRGTSAIEMPLFRSDDPDVEALYQAGVAQAMAAANRCNADAVQAAEQADDAFLYVLARAEAVASTGEFIDYWTAMSIRKACSRRVDSHRRAEREGRALRLVAGGGSADIVDHVTLIEVRDAIDRLDARSRMVVVLRYFEGFSVAEIAEVFVCTPRTVRNWLKAAYTALARSLGDPEGEQTE